MAQAYIEVEVASGVKQTKRNFIGFMARSLSASERRYSTTARELLAVVPTQKRKRGRPKGIKNVKKSNIIHANVPKHKRARNNNYKPPTRRINRVNAKKNPDNQ
ncbi:hypothetical protein K501DRAFT_269070 [Backusella circina FSU 941]|nr:hypothetical protein K501DRAFT_269070 [Backusella circina FSU 941]